MRLERSLRYFWIALAATVALLPIRLFAEDHGQVKSLTLPDSAGPFPAVVLLHGCGGIGSNMPMWQAFFKEQGFASVVVDSFSPRGISEICSNFTRISQFERIGDAYFALRELQKRPDIDIGKVIVMGFSNGAVTTLGTVSRTTVRRLAENQPRFRAGIALYPDCGLFAGVRYSLPLLVLVGDKDDWTPAASCQEMQARTDDKSIEVQIIPGAHHGFDQPGLARTYLPHAVNINKNGGYGATLEGSDAATTLAKKLVVDFLGRVMR